MSLMRITTDRQISTLKPTTKPFEVGIDKSRGLCVRVFPTGAKQFEYRYVALNGARRRHKLGAYPGLSLAEARVKAALLGVQVTSGVDPAAERLAERERARNGDTFSELAESYWKAAKIGLHGGRKRPKRASTIATERLWWRNHIAPKLGQRRFEELKRADIKIFMRELATDSGLAPASIASVGAVVQAVLSFAVHEDRLDANPATGLARPLALTSRDRMFGDAALAVIWKAASTASPRSGGGVKIDESHTRLAPAMGLAIRLLMLTLTRRSEVAGARWAEFDMAARHWTIPGNRAKAKHLHVVPLTDSMLEILAQAKALHPDSAFVFPALKGKKDHLDAHAITRAFSRICIRHELGAGSPHDVRRSGATTLVGRYGVSRLVVGMLLGHTVREGAAATSVYDRHTYLPEKRQALETWSDHIAGIESASQRSRFL